MFAGVNGSGAKASLIQSFAALNDPKPVIESFFAAYPLATEQLLASEDIAYFLAITQRPEQKPVPFTPILCSQFEVWFKKVRTQSYWFHFRSNHLFSRTPFGLQKISKPFSTKTLNASVSSKDLLLSSTPKSKMSLSKTFSVTSTPPLFNASSRLVMVETTARSLVSIISERLLQSFRHRTLSSVLRRTEKSRLC